MRDHQQKPAITCPKTRKVERKAYAQADIRQPTMPMAKMILEAPATANPEVIGDLIIAENNPAPIANKALK